MNIHFGHEAVSSLLGQSDMAHSLMLLVLLHFTTRTKAHADRRLPLVQFNYADDLSVNASSKNKET